MNCQNCTRCCRGCVNASLPLTVPLKRRGVLQTMRQACALCVRIGGRGARRQSLGTEPGMPSLQAKQENGEHSGEGLLTTAAAAATAMAARVAPSARLHAGATQLFKPADQSPHSAGFQMQKPQAHWKEKRERKRATFCQYCAQIV